MNIFFNCFFFCLIQIVVISSVISIIISQFEFPIIISEEIKSINYSSLIPSNLILIELEFEILFENKNLYSLPIQNNNIYIFQKNEKIGFIFLKSSILKNQNKIDALGYFKSNLNTVQTICSTENLFNFKTNILFFEFSFDKKMKLDCKIK